MERRKFIIGAGALATGSSAAVGTGALTSAEASRSLDVDVVDDANALLSLQDGDYSEQSGDTLSVDFTSTSKASETGLNPNATTSFRNVFSIRNQSENDVALEVRGETNLEDVAGIDKAIIYYDEQGGGSFFTDPSKDYGSFSNTEGPEQIPGSSLDSTTGEGAGLNNTNQLITNVSSRPFPFKLDSGEPIRVGFYFETSTADGSISPETVDISVRAVEWDDENTAY